jgi:hypothetical protein
VTAVEALLADYRAYLVGERGLAAASVRCYGAQARTVLTQLPAPLDVTLARLDAATVTAWVVRESATAGSVWSAKTLVTAVRSLLRYLPPSTPTRPSGDVAAATPATTSETPSMPTSGRVSGPC